jgi:hypothetical protein
VGPDGTIQEIGTLAADADDKVVESLTPRKLALNATVPSPG